MIDDDGFSPNLDGLTDDEASDDLDPAVRQEDDAELLNRDDVDFVRGDADPNYVAYLLAGFELLSAVPPRRSGRSAGWTPTEVQIRQMCAAIRSTWSDDVLRSRAGKGARTGWKVPNTRLLE